MINDFINFIKEYKIISFFCFLAIIFLIFVTKNNIERSKQYDIKCIHGHLITVNHSGGIAGPVG